MLRYLCLFFISFNCFANVLQYFAGISYTNPAELFKTKKDILLLGGTSFYSDLRFSGSVLNFNAQIYDSGISASRRISFLPYGRIAKRLNEKTVIGIDITQPFHSNLIWGRNVFTRYASTETLMTDVDLSPRFSFSPFSKINVGGGLNFNFLKNNEVNWALPINQAAYDTLVNRTSGFGLGWNTGVYWAANAFNFLGLSYYSAIKQKTKGESFFNGTISTALNFNFSMPATTIFNYVHLFNPKWLASFQLFCSQWNVNQYAKIKNTAAPLPFGPNFTFTMRYRPSWVYATAIRQQYSEHLGLSLIGFMDTGPERDQFRTINFPSDNQYFLALSADYQLSKKTTMELLYGHVFSNTFIQNQLPINGQNLPFTTGKVRINAEVFELRLKIQN